MSILSLFAWRQSREQNNCVFFFFFQTSFLTLFSGATFVFAFGFWIEALITAPQGFLAHFLAVQYVLWFVSVSLLWQGFPDVGISAELSAMWWNPQPTSCFHNYWGWFTRVGHERDEVDSLDGETLHKMWHGNGLQRWEKSVIGTTGNSSDG